VWSDMKWLALTVATKPADAQTIAAMLGDFAPGGAVIEDTGTRTGTARLLTVTAYLPFSRSLRVTREKIRARIKEMGMSGWTDLKERALTHEEWLDSLKANFAPVDIGRRLLITPSWLDDFPAVSGRLRIELDPGAAFGTGDHPTTRMCLELLERSLTPGMRVLDLGAGTGILAIAAARLGASFALAIDTDPAAVRAAAENVKTNGTTGQVVVKRGTLSRLFQRRHQGAFDVILANIPGPSLVELAQGLFRVAAPGGKLIVSGFNSQGLDEVLIGLALADFMLDDLECRETWRAVLASKPASPKTSQGDLTGL
jgi:ribosomal protein L11 methyltransferase